METYYLDTDYNGDISLIAYENEKYDFYQNKCQKSLDFSKRICIVVSRNILVRLLTVKRGTMPRAVLSRVILPFKLWPRYPKGK